jgi:predicted amidophosphoribosyltransferase
MEFITNLRQQAGNLAQGVASELERQQQIGRLEKAHEDIQQEIQQRTMQLGAAALALYRQGGAIGPELEPLCRLVEEAEQQLTSLQAELQRAQTPPPPPADGCAKCGTPLAAAAAFCPNCGTPRTVVARETTNCANCRAPLIDGATFCGNCGAPVAPAPTNRCRQCQSELMAGAAFCGNCGLPVSQPQPAAPAPAVPLPAPLPPPTLPMAVSQTAIAAPSPQVGVCPQCQSKVVPEDPYCPECGFYYADSQPSAQLPTAASPPPLDSPPDMDTAATVITIPEPKAADTLEELPLFCPHCGEPARPNARFCRHCGQAIQGTMP